MSTGAGAATPAPGARYPTIGVAVTVLPRYTLPTVRGSGNAGAAPSPVRVIDDSAVLLIRRGKEPGRGLWCFPGGRAEWGESMAAAAVREAKEETGLNVVVDDPVCPAYAATDVIYRGQGDVVTYHYGIVHVLTYLDVDLPLQAGGGGVLLAPLPALPLVTAQDDADAAAWFHLTAGAQPDRAGGDGRLTIRCMGSADGDSVPCLRRGGVLVPHMDTVAARALQVLPARAAAHGAVLLSTWAARSHLLAADGGGS